MRRRRSKWQQEQEGGKAGKEERLKRRKDWKRGKDDREESLEGGRTDREKGLEGSKEWKGAKADRKGWKEEKAGRRKTWQGGRPDIGGDSDIGPSVPSGQQPHPVPGLPGELIRPPSGKAGGAGAGREHPSGFCMSGPRAHAQVPNYPLHGHPSDPSAVPAPRCAPCGCWHPEELRSCSGSFLRCFTSQFQEKFQNFWLFRDPGKG